jgi:hypothetical protein
LEDLFSLAVKEQKGSSGNGLQDRRIRRFLNLHTFRIAASAANTVENATESTLEDADENTRDDTDVITGAAGSVVEAPDLWATSPAAIFPAAASSTRSTFNW